MQAAIINRQTERPKLVVFETFNREAAAAAFAAKNTINEALFALQWRESENKTARKLVIIDTAPGQPPNTALFEESPLEAWELVREKKLASWLAYANEYAQYALAQASNKKTLKEDKISLIWLF